MPDRKDETRTPRTPPGKHFADEAIFSTSAGVVHTRSIAPLTEYANFDCEKPDLSVKNLAARAV